MVISVLTIGRRRPTESDRRCLIDIREDLHRPTEANLRIELRNLDLEHSGQIQPRVDTQKNYKERTIVTFIPIIDKRRPTEF